MPVRALLDARAGSSSGAAGPGLQLDTGRPTPSRAPATTGTTQPAPGESSRPPRRSVRASASASTASASPAAAPAALPPPAPAAAAPARGVSGLALTVPGTSYALPRSFASSSSAPASVSTSASLSVSITASASAPSPAPSSPLTPASSAASPAEVVRVAGKGKGRAQRAAEEQGGRGVAERSRRVLPARIRRVGGAEGIRELEEMVVDWLERWGDVDTNPPDSLGVVLTTLPLPLVVPAPYVVDGTAERASETEPPVAGPSTSASTSTAPAPQPPHIETPSWAMVRPGEDDQMEAREELSAPRGHSPTKRLRRGVLGAELAEDTSDAYYEQLHRKFEAFERRQRVREREKLQFERYKMRARIDLLRNLPGPQWASVVVAILARTDDGGTWARGRRKLAAEGSGSVAADWLRRRLIREGVEVLSRYDQLLPNESKQRQQQQLHHGATSLSHVSSPLHSVSPPPQDDSPPAQQPPSKRPRVSLRVSDASAGTSSRRQSHSKATAAASPPKRATRRARMSASYESSLSSPEPSPRPPPKVPKVRLRLSTAASPVNTPVPADKQAKVPVKVTIKAPTTPAPAPAPQTPTGAQPSHTASTAKPSQTPDANLAPKQPRFVPPSTPSGVPVLIEAAQKRESAIKDALAAKAKTEAAMAAAKAAAAASASASSSTPTASGSGIRHPRIVREKTRGSARLSNATPTPFGLPIPAPVESRGEFTISDEEEFWPIIAAREAHATAVRRASMGMDISSGVKASASVAAAVGATPGRVGGGVGVGGQVVAEEEALDMEGVEEAVVL